MTVSNHPATKKKTPKPKRIPGYTRHAPSSQARVRINGKDYYLGEYGSAASHIKYGELIAEHLGGKPIGSTTPERVTKDEVTKAVISGMTVNELCLAFLRHAATHYVKDGKETSEVHCLKLAIRTLVDLYGATPVDAYGPLALKATRQRMIELGWVRKSINTAVGRIRHVFRWGVGNELVDPATWQKLKAVEALLAGRTEAKDNPPRTAVSDQDFTTVKKLVRPLVRDLMELQRLTGARSGELLALTTGIIDRDNPVWTAGIDGHKTCHHGHRRVLTFGPQSQLILTKYLSAKPDKPLFAMTRHAYCRAITRACEDSGIDRWVPHQLRHTAAARVRDQFGLEHTQATLGHASLDMSEHYAKVSLNKSIEVAMKIG